MVDFELVSSWAEMWELQGGLVCLGDNFNIISEVQMLLLNNHYPT